MTGKRGRPKQRTTKYLLSIRLDPDVVERYRATGKGWQTRMARTIERASQRLQEPS